MCFGTRAHTHNSVSLNVTHVFALLPYSARGGVMIHVRLYGLHLLLNGHIHLPFIESSREVHINIHSRMYRCLLKSLYSKLSCSFLLHGHFLSFLSKGDPFGILGCALFGMRPYLKSWSQLAINKKAVQRQTVRMPDSQLWTARHMWESYRGCMTGLKHDEMCLWNRVCEGNSDICAPAEVWVPWWMAPCSLLLPRAFQSGLFTVKPLRSSHRPLPSMRTLPWV